jgi:hypothetical protein
MDANEYESTEFYSYKFKNFSTMVIIPAAIFVLLLFIGSFLLLDRVQFLRLALLNQRL